MARTESRKWSRRVAKDLIANDETEISEVVRRRPVPRRLGKRAEDPQERRQGVRRLVLRASRAAAARMDCGGFSGHGNEGARAPATSLRGLFIHSIPQHCRFFQRKWQTLPQYQQTRGTLAMLAQWISIAAQDTRIHQGAQRAADYTSAHTTGRVRVPRRSVGRQLVASPRLVAAIDTDIAGQQAHSQSARRRHQWTASRISTVA